MKQKITLLPAGIKKNHQMIRMAILCVILAYLLRIYNGMGLPFGEVTGFFRALLYLGLFAGWGISLRARIIKPQVRRLLIQIVALMVFWLLVRTIKFNIDDSITEPKRYLWYLYYVGMLFIPLLAMLISMFIGKPESYRLPSWSKVLPLITAVLLLLVLTNDFHQLVFTFPSRPYTDGENGYHWGYYVILGWEIFCALASLILMLKKCRLPHSKKVLLLPFVPFVLIIAYALLYVSGLPALRRIAGDATVTECLAVMAILESCIQCRLIPSNMHYSELFQAFDASVYLTDEENRVLLSTGSAGTLSAETVQAACEGPVILEGGMRLSAASIRGGHVLWTDDVSELLAIMEELQGTRESLEDDNALLRAEYKLKAREAHIAEQDRIYDEIQHQTAGQIQLLSGLTDEFEVTETEEERVRILGKMIVIGAYLKRRNNLIFVSDKAAELDVRELELAFRESMDNLDVYGVVCGFRTELTGRLPSEDIITMYDFFEKIVETAMDTMKAMTVVIGRQGMKHCITVNVDLAENLEKLSSDLVTVLQDEDGEWQLRMVLGGDEG